MNPAADATPAGADTPNRAAVPRDAPARARDWDAATYERVSDAQYAWGLEVLGRLRLGGDERVLDAGCGTGRVTAKLLERLPRGHVIAVDASPAMVARTVEALGTGVDALCQDLLALSLAEPVDAILSTAVFHWIDDHATLFSRLHDSLRKGGQLEAQCGGEGNIANLRAVVEEVSAAPPFDRHLGGWSGPWRFPRPEPTEDLLRRAGFVSVRCRLEPRLLRSDEPEAFLSTVSLGTHLERLPADLRKPFVASVARCMGSPLEVDYVRLNIAARRA